jgi:hypothetical protein
MLQLFAVIIVFGLLIYAMLYAVVKFGGGTVKGGMARIVPLLLWLVMTVQTLAQVARVSSPSLPPLLQVLFRYVALIQLQGIVLPPSCTGGYPFQTEASEPGELQRGVCFLRHVCARALGGVGSTG